ncbi:MAG: lipoate--protein ligase family protein [Acidimicrobiia bacterium]|nr:lipoate--protein ligase family protein [Acidimicrobiia bacterium]
MPRRTLLLYREGFPSRPRFDTAVSRALLEAAASGRAPESFRLFVPGRVLAFGTRDVTHPGYARAAAAARAQGFPPLERLAGGRAAVFHEETLAFAWAVPDPEPRHTIHDRYRALAALVVEALHTLGVDARVGEVPGEYCPGEYSVNYGGRRKLMGVGQRLVAGAAHVGGVVVAGRPDLVNRALAPVYTSLGFEWDPGVTGSVADTVPADLPAVTESLVAALRSRHEVVEALLPPEILQRAEALAAPARPPR